MGTLQLTKQQSEFLIEILENSLSDLRMEIAHTDSPFYKDRLRDKKEQLIGVLNELKIIKEE